MYVKEWMSHPAISIGREASVFEAKRLLLEHGIRHLPVTGDGEVVGVATLTDLLRATAEMAAAREPIPYHSLIQQATVEGCMTSPALTVLPEDTVEQAALLMRENKIGCLPVVQRDLLVGMLTVTDLFDALIDSLGLRRGGARVIFNIDPGQESETLAHIGDWLRQRKLELVSLAVYTPRGEEAHPRIMLRAKGPGAEGPTGAIR